MVSGTRLAGPPGPMPRFKSLVFKDSIRDEPRSGKKEVCFYEGGMGPPKVECSLNFHW